LPDGQVSRAELLNATGAHYHGLGNIEAARVHYNAALMSEPMHGQALQNLCGALTNFDLYEASVSVGRRAVRADPTNRQAKMNLAAALVGLRRFAEAKQIMQPLMQDMSGNPALWHNFGLALYMSGDRLGAMEELDKASALRDEPAPVVEGDRSLCTLSLGMIGLGMERYDACRWKLLGQHKIWQAGIAEWQGEDLQGKTLIVSHEQGFGDTIMLCRFIPQLQERGATVVLAVPGSLVRLMEFSFPDVRCVDWDTTEVWGDFHSPFMSVMRWLSIEPEHIESASYLHAGPLTSDLPPREKLRIGICWESGDHGAGQKKSRRVVPLELFFKLAELPGVSLISLQKAQAQEQILARGAESFIYDPMGRCSDFADTAAIIEQLDIVISVDSAVVHLAGGLGKPVIMLGPFTRCWRWWGERHGLPWYEHFAIVRQSRDGTWTSAVSTAVEMIQKALKR
jgi:hypothetical protein